MPIELEQEWLETDGGGGFASGTVRGPRTRRYHALLLTAAPASRERVVLVNGFDAWVEVAEGRFALTAQNYLPDVQHPDGSARITGFTPHPWPHWRFRLEDGTEVTQELLVDREAQAPATWMRWRLTRRRFAPTRLILRPFLSGRSYHALHRENPAFQFAAEQAQGVVRWQPYPDLPAVEAASNSTYTHEPVWYRAFRYDEECRRGLDFVEDLGSPGWLAWDLDQADAFLTLRAIHSNSGALDVARGVGPQEPATVFAAEARRRAAFASPLKRAADQYIIRRGAGRTIVAGYPWFTDWGRDTFIAMRGLCLATGRLDAARDILLAWAGTVSDGMLPNRFTDIGDAAEYNAVDASLWFVVAVQEYMAASASAAKRPSASTQERLWRAVEAILTGYRHGTRFGIRMDSDGLLAAGEPGLQLTWMDAKVGNHVVTPRIGKPVEIQALWLNALRFGATRDAAFDGLFEHGLTSFRTRFWREDSGCLYDVVDVDHVPGRVDAAFRPNQIFAVGGLPVVLLEPEAARRLIAAVEDRLLTPLGLRSLAPGEDGYRARFQGGVFERDTAYHQGTVWPWLMGSFVEAWLRVHGSTAQTRATARSRFLEPLLAHAEATAGVGHVSEVADAEAPHRPGGCPFQAWSLGELLRALRLTDPSADAAEEPSA